MMDRFLAGKLKRKDLDELHDDFAEILLLSPARKIRRLDVELPSIVEEDDLAVPMGLDNQMWTDEMIPVADGGIGLGNVVVQRKPDCCSANDERALVVFKPMENPLLLSPGDPCVSFTVSSDIIHGLKNNFFKPTDESLVEMDEKAANTNNCLAVVPWAPSRATIHARGFNDSELHLQLEQEPMEDEVPEAASMEVEEVTAHQPQNLVGNEGIQQWPQQHWLIPNTSDPIMWS